ncbi:MAG: alpha/beta hydrolase [Vicinamibacterales bacterium]
MPHRLRASLTRPVIWLFLALVVALVAFVRGVERRLAFYPLDGEPMTPATLGAPFEPRTIETADGERVRLWKFSAAQPRALVVYFHGNGGNLSLWSDVLVSLWQRRLDVVALDYRGYGVSTGTPSESGLYADVDATLRFVHADARQPGVPLIYWGRSLGATMAAYAASRRPPDAVILEAGFPSARAVLESSPVLWLLSWISSYRFPTARWMSAVERPVLVIHGNRDGVIPYALGQRLFEGLRAPKQFVTIEGGDHNDAAPADPAIYWTPIDDFIAGISSDVATPPSR